MSEAVLTAVPEVIAPEGAVETIVDWRQSLPESVQGWEETKNAQSAEAFYDNIGDMRSMIGRSLQIPGPDASVEVQQAYLQKVIDKSPQVMMRPDSENMDEFYNAMGRPEDSGAYQAPASTDELPVNEQSLDMFRQIAYDAGLSQSQFEQMSLGMSQATLNGQNASLEARNGELTSLKGEWGMAYDQNIAIAEKIKQDYFPHIEFAAGELDPATLKSLHSLGKAMLGEGMQVVPEQGASGIMTPAEAQHTINEIMGNKDHAYWSPSHPGHKAAIDRVLKLHKFKGA